jgi:hypothetical protein
VLFRTVDPEHEGMLVRAMVGDLGLGKALDVSSRLTMIAGTPSFVAPEQAQGEHLDARADQYSLAALSYLLLTGRPPYAHGTLSAAANPAPPAPMSTPERPFPPAVEGVVRRGLAVDRDDRFPDVRSYVDSLRTALGESATGELPARWLPVDPELTQPGNRPSLVPAREDLPAPVPPERRRRWPAVVLALVLLVAGGVAGFVAWQRTHADVTHTDKQGALSVTVPSTWNRDVSTSGWVPPDSSTNYPALSVGDGRDWASKGQGVFVGLMPESKLPRTLPQHSGCQSVGKPVTTQFGNDPARTVTSTRCPGVVIERVVQVTTNELLWIQVRSDDEATARKVLESVSTQGLF